LMVTRGDSGKY